MVFSLGQLGFIYEFKHLMWSILGAKLLIIPLSQQVMRTNIYKRIELQSLIDELALLQGQLEEGQAEIHEWENEYLTNIPRKNHVLLGWHRSDYPLKKVMDICPKDKRFSLSSVFSRASQELLNLQDRKLPIVEKTKYVKKKKNRRSKIRRKTLKRRPLRRSKK